MSRNSVAGAVWLAFVHLAAPFAVAGVSLSYGGAGTDGAFAPTQQSGVLTVDLRQALTAAWDHAITAEELAEGSDVYGRGVYDAAKWAVVFKYSSIDIPAGLTVKFTNHASRAPVVWLVTGDVTIAGTVALDGQNMVNAPALAEPGPGGFRGGMGYYATGSAGSAGFGPGGGDRKDSRGYGAGHSTSNYGAPVYGNPSLLPLVGGSGGAGDQDSSSGVDGGGAGGGAFLIVATGTVSLAGSIHANGGVGRSDYYSAGNRTGSGSGGGIRIVCSLITGAGSLQAKGGESSHPGGLGRIRIERVAADEGDGELQCTPLASVVALEDGSTPLIWPPDDGPSVRVVSIGGVAVPADPRASFGAAGPDVAVAEAATTEVVVETVNVEAASSVYVRVTPRANANYTRTLVPEEGRVVLSDDPLTIRWTVSVPAPAGHSAVQVQVVRP